MQKNRRSTRGRKCRRNLAPDQPRLAHARDHHAPFASEQHLHSALESRVETRLQFLQRLGLNAQNASRRLQTREELQVRTSLAMGANFASRAGSKFKRSALDPSDSAPSGRSCTSRKIPSTPTAVPARASGSINSGCPPLDLPCPPGNWTE